MTQKEFEISIIRQHWINDDGLDDNKDLCSHGEIYIRIGNEVISNKDSGSWTLSATGLFLLRSLSQDCDLDQFSNQLVPCCGHFIIPSDDDENYVVITGCPNGIDWTIKHHDDKVTFTSIKGTSGTINLSEYIDLVMNFTNQIENFYGKPEDKITPDDEFDKKGFKQFWAEWKELKNKWKNDVFGKRYA